MVRYLDCDAHGLKAISPDEMELLLFALYMESRHENPDGLANRALSALQRSDVKVMYG